MAETNKESQVKHSKNIRTPKGVNNENFIDWYEKEERRVDDLKLSDYRSMLNDGQISMLWNSIVNTILSSGLDIIDDEDYTKENPDEPSDELKFIKRNLLSTQWKGGLSKSLELTNRTMLRAFIEGFRVFEVIHRTSADGKIELDRLDPRAGKSDNEITLLVDKNGNFDGFKQQNVTQPDKNHEIIVRNNGGISKAVKATYGEEFGSLYGRSGFKSIWYHYDKAHKGMYLNHVGHELGAIKFRKVIAKTSDEDKIQSFVDLLELVGVETVISYNEDEFDLVFESASDAQVMAVGKDMIGLHYDMIAKAFLLQFINLGSSISDTGSRALGETGKDFFKEGLQQLAKILIEDTWNTVISDLIRVNFNRGIYPTLKVNPIDDAVSDLLLNAFLDMAKTGKISKSVSSKLQAKASDRLELGIGEELISEELNQKAEQVAKMGEALNTKPESNVDKKQIKVDGEDTKLSDHSHNHIHLADGSTEHTTIKRELFEDEKKVKFFEIKERLDDAMLRGKRLLRLALQRQKTGIVNEFIKAAKQGTKAINAVEIQLSDQPTYSEQLIALATELHEYGKITAANELNKPVPQTKNKQKQELVAKIENVVGEQTARLKFRLTNVANMILNGDIELSDYQSNRINLAETTVGQSMLEDEFDSFFSSIDNVMLSAMVPDSFNQGRATTFDAYAGDIVAYRYVAVLDDRTTDFCRALDGSVFKVLDPDLAYYRPPNHYGCRSILVAITAEEFRAQGLEFTGAPDELPQFGSGNQFKDIVNQNELISSKALDTLKRYGVVPEGNTITIRDGVVTGSGNVYNKILENITKNLTGKDQADALQALYDILPAKGKDPIADTVRNLLESIYNVKPKKLGVNVSPSVVSNSGLTNTHLGVLEKTNTNVISKSIKDSSGYYDGNNIFVDNSLSPAEQFSTTVHEIGHVIDQLLGNGDELFSESSQFQALMSNDNIFQIIRNRVNLGDKMSTRSLRDLIFAGNATTIDGRVISMPNKLRFYYMSPAELFAEGYRLYAEGNESFRFNSRLWTFYDNLNIKLKANYGA